MNTTNKLLDTVRKVCGVKTDSALATKLGVTRALVSGWRSDRYNIPDEKIAAACAMAKLDGPEWMALVHAERAATPAERALWRAALDRLTPAVAAVGALLFAGMLPLSEARANAPAHVRNWNNGGDAHAIVAITGQQDLATRDQCLLCQ